MAAWLVTYTDGRDEQKIEADRIRQEAGHMLAFHRNYEENPFLWVNSEVINTITLLDPTSPNDS